MRQLNSLRGRPEVDVEEVRRIGEHMTVQRGDGDALLTQSPKNKGDFFGNLGKVPRNGSIPVSRRLKVDSSGDTHRWRDHHACIRDGFPTGNAVLVDPVIGLAMIAQNGIELCGIKLQRARWTGRR